MARVLVNTHIFTMQILAVLSGLLIGLIGVWLFQLWGNRRWLLSLLIGSAAGGSAVDAEGAPTGGGGLPDSLDASGNGTDA
jgi:hypothetical protein